MNIRIWSKKIVAVLHHYRSNPHTILWGVTGDLDNLGVYVARNGRAKAEILVDSYNRVIGSIFYNFINQHPHLFHESHFLPAGEEVFILGTCANEVAVKGLFQHLQDTSIPQPLIQAGLDPEIRVTDASFSCCVLNPFVNLSLVDDMLARIDSGDVIGANRIYSGVIQKIRHVLAIQLDLKKFSDTSQDERIAVLLRNIIYAKTLQYKKSTKNLLLELGERIANQQEVRDHCIALLGNEYGLQNKDHTKILIELAHI